MTSFSLNDLSEMAQGWYATNFFFLSLYLTSQFFESELLAPGVLDEKSACGMTTNVFWDPVGLA